ncbi:MAG: Rpn family recombination-promoting nuclease/putative transposase [Syntrophobacteraceae bacterium]
MDQDIWKPHDRLFKQLLGEPRNAASFLESNLPSELTSLMDLDALEVLQESFIDEQFKQSEADLLLATPIANRPGYVYILFEHQSSPDAFMALRLLSYMVRVWERFRRENPENGKLPAIIPMVLFHGPRGWQGAPAFEVLVDAPDDVFAPHTPKFLFRLFDLSPLGEEELAGNAVVRILGDALGAYGRRDFKVRVARAFDALNELANAPGFARYLEVLFRYVLQVHDIPKEELVQLVTQTVKPNVREAVMTTYEQLIEEGKQIGLLEGKKRGWLEGFNSALLRQLSKKFQADAIALAPLLSGLTPEQQDELSDKILDAGSLDEIVEWLKATRHN